MVALKLPGWCERGGDDETFPPHCRQINQDKVNLKLWISQKLMTKRYPKGQSFDNAVPNVTLTPFLHAFEFLREPLILCILFREQFVRSQPGIDRFSGRSLCCFSTWLYDHLCMGSCSLYVRVLYRLCSIQQHFVIRNS
jgi:hypothetical protein